MGGARKPGNTSLVNPMAGRLGYQLRRASVAMMEDLHARLGPTGLRPAEVSILLLIGANPGCRQGAVGDLLGIQRSNMVPLVAALMAKQLVVRTRADGRSIALSLTPQGRAMVKATNRLIDRHERAFAARLDPETRAALLGLLAALSGGSTV